MIALSICLKASPFCNVSALLFITDKSFAGHAVPGDY